MKKQKFKTGDIVHIRPAWCDAAEEMLLTYYVVEELGDGKYLIQTIGGALQLKPTEVVTGEMIELVTTLEELEERS